MKEKVGGLITRAINSELISGSFYLFLGTMLGNILAFVFNLLLVRNLSYANYAEITAIVSLITLVGIPTTALLPTIIQFAGRYLAKNQIAEASELLWQSTKNIALFVCILLICFMIFSPFLANFLHIKSTFEIMLAGIIVGAMYLSIANTAFLQSLLKFQFLSFTLTLGGVLKLFIGIGLLFAGFGIVGILWGIFLAFFIPLCITFFPLRHLFTGRFKKKTTIHAKEILVYGLPATLAMFSLSSFTSSDILLVKHFFPSTEAAYYSGLSLIGRIIFYFSLPISTAMFPLLVKRFHKGEKIQNLLFLSFFLVFAPSIVLTIIYFAIPKFIIAIILGRHYAPIAPYLGWFGLYLAIFSLLYVSVNFLLSIKKTSVSWFVAVGALLQIVGISLFHSSLVVVIAISLILSLVLFVTLLLYYQHTYATHKAKN